MYSPILGVPVVVYPIRAALLSSKTHAVYVSTEDTLIRSIAENQGVKIIDRPAALSQSDSLHKDVIAHAVKVASEEIPSAENFCVLLGNTVMVTPGLIDKSFSILESGEWDSCLSVWKAQDDHPYRALKVDSDGCVQSFLNIDCTSNRQSYPTVFFYDQGIWAFKRDCAFRQEGPIPWVWLGKKCTYVERPWVTGRDIHSWIDLSASAWYLSAIQALDHEGYAEDIGSGSG